MVGKEIILEKVVKAISRLKMDKAVDDTKPVMIKFIGIEGKKILYKIISVGEGGAERGIIFLLKYHDKLNKKTE